MDQHLSPTRRAHLGDPIAVDQIAAVDRVRPQPTAHPDEDRALLSKRDLDLLPGRREHHAGLLQSVTQVVTDA